MPLTLADLSEYSWKKIALFANLPLLPRNKTILSISENGPSLPKKVSRDYKSNLIHYLAVFSCVLSFQGGRRMTTPPLIQCATTQLRSCMAWSWRITTTASARWKKSRAWARSSSSARAQRMSATSTSFSTLVSQHNSIMITYFFLILDSWGVSYPL